MPEPLLWYCAAFPNYSGIQAIVRAPSVATARAAASDIYYGRPANVRLATEDELKHHTSFGGEIIEAMPK